MAENGQINPLRIMVILFILLFVLLFVIALYILSSDQEIYITRDGLFFPPLMSPSLSIKTKHVWSDLTGLSFAKTNYGCENLALTFNRSRKVSIDLSKIPEADVDKMLVALEVWGGGKENFPAILDLRANLRSIGKSEDAHGPTQTELWEEELASRFAATNFVPLEPGAKLQAGSLQVLRQIAFGGMSAVYLVSKNEGERYILKESSVPEGGDLALKEKADQMLEREARLLTAIDHPRIARVIDHFVEDSRNYLLLEHISGMDLRRLIKEYGPQPERIIISAALDLVDIIEYLHSMAPPVIHKDLTPSNIIMEDDNHLTVIDFGTANQFLGTATGTIVGKQAYMPPEQLRGKATVKSDIYALGCTLYFMATGIDPVPIQASDIRSCSNKVDEFSTSFCNLVLDCTNPDPSDRPGSAEEVMARLEGLY